MRLAAVERYLASLPGGIAAHPECAHEGDSLSVWLQRSPTSGLEELLPPEPAALLASKHHLPAWVSDVHATVLYLAIREARFEDDTAFLAHARECNRAVLETPLNRILFCLASPKAILRGASVRWGALHRGSATDIRFPNDNSAEAELIFPIHLFPEIVLRGTATGIAAAVEKAGGRDVVVDLRSVEPRRAHFAIRWT